MKEHTVADSSIVDKIENNHGVSSDDVEDKNDCVQECQNTENESSNIQINCSGEDDQWIDILGTGHLKKRILTPSTSGVRPERTDLCTISYNGYLGETIVDCAVNKEIHLGDLEVIHGIDLALALMDVGEEVELIIAPRFAYGSLGRKPSIPPDATLRYVVTLSKVENEVPIVELPVDKRLKLGNVKKERGNWWYTREEHPFAIQCYRRALEYFDETDIDPPYTCIDVEKMVDAKLKTYNNLAAAQIKVNALDGALISLGHVLTCEPNNIKALYRKAKILKEQGSIEGSISEIRKALAIQPDSHLMNQELSSLLALQRENNAKEVNLFKKMMGNESNIENSSFKESDSSNSSNSNHSWMWLAVVSVAAAVIGAFAMKYKY